MCTQIYSRYLVYLPPLYVVVVLNIQGHQKRRVQPHIWNHNTKVNLGYGNNSIQCCLVSQYLFTKEFFRPLQNLYQIYTEKGEKKRKSGQISPSVTRYLFLPISPQRVYIVYFTKSSFLCQNKHIKIHLKRNEFLV